MKKNKRSLFKINNCKNFTYLFLKYIKVYTNAQKIRKLETINQNVSVGQITFSYNKNHYKLSLYQKENVKYK